MAPSLSERDAGVIWHPYTPQKYAPRPIPVQKGKDTLLFAEDGTSYIDAISSWWVTLHGHGNRYIADAIYRQALELEQVIFARFTHEPAVTLAERLLNVLPGNFSKVFYSDNGSTAVEVAIKMALQYWSNKGERSRNKIIALEHSYHGDTFGAMSVSERGLFTYPFQDKLFEVVFTPLPGDPGDDANIAESVLQEAACIIYEPLVQGAGGMKMHSPETLDLLLRRCQAHGVICIADEVMTGFGRTGRLFASEYCTVQPDIICLSKGITGGTMALGATCCTGAIHEAFVDDDRRKTFFHGHSFTANPIACAAALASLDLLLSKSCNESIRTIEAANREFADRLSSREEYFGISGTRCRGTILAFEAGGRQNNYLDDIKETFTEKSMQRGVYLRPLGNTVYIMPPYCITPSELESVYQVIIDILEEIKMQE